ncbi:MAG: hypothetical protein ACRC2V_24850 [Xenococcaceae cyanobacterium]
MSADKQGVQRTRWRGFLAITALQIGRRQNSTVSSDLFSRRSEKFTCRSDLLSTPYR